MSSERSRWLTIVVGAAIGIATSTFVGVPTTATAATPQPPAALTPTDPARILETRTEPGATTVDGLFQGVGRAGARSIIELQVAGRGGVPVDAEAVMLNLAAVVPSAAGYLQTYPCDQQRPVTSNVNYLAGTVVANSALVKIGAAGTVCVFTLAPTDIIADVNGYVPAGGSMTAVEPARLADSRVGPNNVTIDGQHQGFGRTVARSITEIQVTGRADVPADADAVIVSVAAIGANEPGYLSVFGCDTPRAGTSTINYQSADVVANLALSGVDGGGAICVFALTEVDLIIDIASYVSLAGALPTVEPARLLETRTGSNDTTIDGSFEGIGRAGAGTEIELQVTGRGGVPDDAEAAMLNVAAILPSGPGYLTVYPCGVDRPRTSSVNYLNGQVVANAVLAKIGAGGRVCVFTLAAVDIIADVTGYVPATPTNAAPSITSDGGGASASVNVVANTSTVTNVDASDGDGDTENGGGLTYSIDNTATFSINAAGLIRFRTPPSTVGTHNVTVTVTDSTQPTGLTDTQAITVTVTPDPQRGTIIVEKQTGPDGAPGSFTFTGDVAGTISDGGTITVGNLVPGSYTSTETSLAGFDLTGITCDDANSTGNLGTRTATFNVAAGETVRCVFTNTQRGSIVVEQQVLPDGTPGSFTFTGDAAGTISDGGTITVGSLVPGAYTATQSTPPSGFDLSALVCDDANSSGSIATATASFNVEPGETVTCTFTNSFNQPPEIVGGETATVDANENQTAVTDVDANDDNDAEGAGLLYSFSTDSGGGVDNGFFSIVATTGVLTFSPAPDFEAMADDNGDNDYEVQVTVTDSGPGPDLSDLQDITVTLVDVNEAPIVTTTVGTSAFTEGGGAVTVDSGVTVSDEDGDTLASATVTIVGGPPDGTAEVLACQACGGIGAVFSSGTLTLTGPDTVANFQAALRSVTYDNTSLAPTETDRAIRFVVNDGALDSLDADRAVSVAGVNSPPTAVDDVYTAVVNARLDAGVGLAGIDVDTADGVLTSGTDDSDPEGNALVVVGIVGCSDVVAPFTDCLTANGGTVTMDADGTFTYVSLPGDAAANDSFDYTLSDGSLTDIGTVTINFGASTIWFIDNSEGGVGGVGTSVDPFKTIGDFNAATTDEGDIVYLHAGMYDAGITLSNSQRLIGEGVALTGLLNVPAGTRPTITTTTGNAITLDVNNTVRGLNVGNTPNGHAIQGVNVGAPIVNNIDVTGTGGIVRVAGGNLSAVFLGTQSSTSSPAGPAAIDLANLSGTYSGGSPSILNSAGAGIQLTNNSGAAFFFTSVTIDNSFTNQPGVVAVNNGSVQITGGTVNAGSATSVQISDTSTGVLLSRVDSVGGTTAGVSLTNTTGFFTVTGSSTGCQNNPGSCSGGSITNKFGNADGITLTNVTNVTLNDMNISNNDGNGIRGVNVNGFVIDDSRLDGNADQVSPEEAGLFITELTGSATISNTLVANSHADNAVIRNSAGTLTSLVVNQSTFGPNSSGSGDNGLQIISSGSATLNVSVQGSSFTGARSVMLLVDVGGTGGGTVNVGNATANTFTQGQANLPSGGAIEVLASGSGNTTTVTTNIANNTILAGSNTFEGDPIVVGNGSGFAGTTNITLDDNQVGINGSNGSAVNAAGGQGDTGIVITQNGTGTMNALVTNNRVFDYNDRGIEVFYDAEGPSSPNGGTLNITVTGNTITDAGGENHGFQFTGGDIVDTCMNISGNNFTSPAGDEIRVDVFGEAGATFDVVGLVTLTEAGIDAHWVSTNTLGGAGPNVEVFGLSPSTIGTAASCPIP